MKKILVLLNALLMVGCEAKEQEKPKQIIKEAIKQEQQVDKPKEEPKEESKKEAQEEAREEAQEKAKQVEKELPKKTVKESPKKEAPKKKEQDDNIDPETGLANVKDGTHLEEEAKKQEELGIIEPEEKYNEEDYSDEWIIEYGNTDEIDDYSEENEYN